MKLYHIKDDYIKYLERYDSKVSTNKSEKRPYVGIVFEIKNYKYYAPLSSPKKKHLSMKNTVDFRKISNGKYGAINFNNMIPIKDEVLILIDIKNIEDEKYKRLLQNQYDEVRKNDSAIKNNAQKLYMMVTKNEDELKPHEQRVKERCVDFLLLESVFEKFRQPESSLKL